MLTGVVRGLELRRRVLERVLEAGPAKADIAAGLSDPAAGGVRVREIRHAVGAHAPGVPHQLAERLLPLIPLTTDSAVG